MIYRRGTKLLLPDFREQRLKQVAIHAIIDPPLSEIQGQHGLICLPKVMAASLERHETCLILSMAVKSCSAQCEKTTGIDLHARPMTQFMCAPTDAGSSA